MSSTLPRKGMSKRWKAGLTALLIIVVSAILFNLWFLNNTNHIIESIVDSKSGGKLELKLKKSKFHYLSNKLELQGATFVSKDSNAATAYKFQLQKLQLKVKSFWSFLLYKELLIDSISLDAPDVTVTRLREVEKDQNKQEVSIPEEMGKIYNSILDALNALQVKRFQIEQGRFTLVNKINPAAPPTTISNIHFHINNLNITNDSANQKFLYSDDVVLQVSNQQIALPDGIHNMSFKNLVVNARQKKVEIDSCWLRAKKIKDSTSFTFFFDVLKLSNIDFDALYARNLIRADSVYITNPDIELILALKAKKEKEKAKKIELNNIIREFAGDLDLGYIGVQNADVAIITQRNGITNTYTSENDNFHMVNLTVNSDSARPVHVDEFAMTVRNYETYSRDSSRTYRFDSIRFENNKIRLSNFTVRTLPGRKGSQLNYTVPAFELADLSWEDLFFDQDFRAAKATLYGPTIHYQIVPGKKKAKKTSLFQVLSQLNQDVHLQQFEIVNGNLNIRMPSGAQLNLQSVDLLLASKALLQSKSYTGIQQAIDELSFSKAVFNTAELTAELHNLRFTDQLVADQLIVAAKNKAFTARVKNIVLNDMVWNNEDKTIYVDGLRWQQGTVAIQTGISGKKRKSAAGRLELKNLLGRNTSVTVNGPKQKITTLLQSLRIAELRKTGAKDLAITGLVAAGVALDVQGAANIRAEKYHITDGGTSTLEDVSFTKYSTNDSIDLTVPSVHFVAELEDLMQGRMAFSSVALNNPGIRLQKIPDSTLVKQVKATRLPALHIGELAVNEPQLSYVKRDTGLLMDLQWRNGTQNTNRWVFRNISTDPSDTSIAIGGATINGSSFVINKRNSQQQGIDSGSFRFEFDGIHARKKDTAWEWSAALRESIVKSEKPFLLKNNRFFGFDEFRFLQLNLSSESIKDYYKLLINNPRFQMNVTQGRFNATSNFQWKKLSYSQADRSLVIDSFQIIPTLSKDSFMATAPYQTDLISTTTQNILLQGIDIGALKKDSVLQAGRLVINNPQLDIFRDKGMPMGPQKLKPLPVMALLGVDAKLSLDTVQVNNATISYTERNAKSDEEGTITLNRMNAVLYPVRNVNLGENDSLTLRADAWLMDTAWLRLWFRESYQDSLGSFALTVRMKPADLLVLNPALIPMASIKLVSGQLDTVTMRAVGHEYFSLGEMQMYYRNLKVRFLKKGDETKRGFITNVLTYIANNILLKRNNSSRTGVVYFPRIREKSIFNFLIKTTMSGVASSVGAKNNKKYLKQYRRERARYNLPPIEINGH
jgi:hypothetical protein